MKHPGVWCCDRRHRCGWQGFLLHQGLSWGTIPSEHGSWCKCHDLHCSGTLVQLLEPQDPHPEGEAEGADE